MITPTPAEVVALKADARRRFGSDRTMLVQLTDPIDAALVLSPFDLVAYKPYVDARAQSTSAAQAGAVVDRVLWCSPAAEEPTVDTLAASPDDPDPLRRVALDRLELLRTAWPAVDSEVETELRKAAGQVMGVDFARGVRLTTGVAPRGLAPIDAAKLLDGTPARGAGSLWTVSHSNGLALVLRAPQPEAWLAARAAFGEAHGKKSGIVDSILVLARQLIVWSPEPIDAYLDAHPGYAEALWNPMLDMGGAAAKAVTTFL